MLTLVAAIVVIASILVPVRHSPVDSSGDSPTRSRVEGRVFGLSAVGSGTQGLAALAETSRAVGHHVDVVNFYVAWIWQAPVPVKTLDAVHDSGALPEITWEPWDQRAGPDQPAFALQSIAAGAYDTYLTAWARQLSGYRKPVLLRFGHEMNGTWYPWSVLRNGGTPAAYIAAYRHVHDMFARAGADNVKWGWSPNVIGQGRGELLVKSFPGADYVDVIGIDGYNFGSASTSGWITPEALFGPTLATLRGLPKIPIWINETGSSSVGGDEAAWIRDLFAYLRRQGVTGVMWFELPTSSHPALRLAGTSASQRAAVAGLSQW